MPDLVSLTTLHCLLEGPVATLTLDRPEVLHALNSVMFDELELAFTTLAADPAIRAVILTGSGDRAFAAGADIRALAETDASTGLAASQRGQQVCPSSPVGPSKPPASPSSPPSTESPSAAAANSPSPAPSASPATKPASASPKSNSASSPATVEPSASPASSAAAPPSASCSPPRSSTPSKLSASASSTTSPPPPNSSPAPSLSPRPSGLPWVPLRRVAGVLEAVARGEDQPLPRSPRRRSPHLRPPLRHRRQARRRLCLPGQTPRRLARPLTAPHLPSTNPGAPGPASGTWELIPYGDASVPAGVAFTFTPVLNFFSTNSCSKFVAASDAIPRNPFSIVSPAPFRLLAG